MTDLHVGESAEGHATIQAMIILGVILILIGAAIAYFFSPERLAQFGGAVLVIAGVILLLIGVLDHADVETAWRSSWG